MNLSDRNLIRIFAALTCALVAQSLSGCASNSSGGVCHHDLFQSQPDTLEYPGEHHFWNKAGLVISPARILAQVGTEVPMFAGVCDDKGQLQAYEKVEWSLDHTGVGSFASVAEANRPIFLDLLSEKVRKIDSSYAVSETLSDNVILTRGTPNINDDMVMPHGYTWVTVSSPREGISYVTAFAPDVYSWDVRQKSATIHWIDAEWNFPEPVCANQGNPATLCTCVVRHTTKAPVSDWIVKYTITGGAEAGFGHEASKSVEIATDAEGRACVEVVPGNPTVNGTACIRVELIRSECAAQGEGERLPIASSATQVTWGSPETSAAPTTVAPAVPANVPQNIPATPMPGPQPSPQPVPNPNPPVTTPQIQSQVPPAQPAAAPKIELNVTGPQTAQLGEDITFNVELVNRGNAPATGLVVFDSFAQGLRHRNRNGTNDVSPIQKSLDSQGPIPVGGSQQMTVQFRVGDSGNLCHTVEVRGPAGVYASKQICVNVAAPPEKPPQAAMKVDITAPQRVYNVKDIFTFQIEVRNTDTTIPTRNVKVDVTFDTGLNVNRASDGALRIPGGVQFTIDTLSPGTAQTFGVECVCVAPAQRACGQVAISDASDLHLGQQFCVQILPPQQAAAAAGQSNLNLSISAVNNPVKVGGEANFRVTIANNGANSEKQVQLRITIPDNMTLATNPTGPAFPTVDGRTITFSPILELRSNETPLNFDLRLRANNAGTAEVVAEIVSSSLSQPIQKSTTIKINPQ